MRNMIGKLLAEVEKAESEQKRELMRTHRSPALMEVMLIAAGVRPLNPELVVNYKPSGFSDVSAAKRLISEHSIFYIYRRTAGDIVSISELFNRSLSQMTSEEAEYLVGAHEATLLGRLGLTVDDLRDVFGDAFEDAMDVAAFDEAKADVDDTTHPLDDLVATGAEIGVVDETPTEPTPPVEATPPPAKPATKARPARKPRSTRSKTTTKASSST